MFFKPATVVVVSALVALAAATPVARTDKPASECSTGPVQCCNTVTDASDPAAAGILGLLGIVIQDLNVGVGLTCSPISVIGVGGNSCSASPVCCENNSFNGLIAIGCVPVDINL